MSQILPTLWHTRYLMQLSLSIDIGGTKVLGGVVDSTGKIIAVNIHGEALKEKIEQGPKGMNAVRVKKA